MERSKTIDISLDTFKALMNDSHMLQLLYKHGVSMYPVYKKAREEYHETNDEEDYDSGF